jgi:uronate dehydrogenase
MAKRKVLLTGAGGRIGPHLVGPFQEHYDLRTFDLRPVPGDPDAILGDLQDFEALKRAMEGVEVVVHLAAISNEAPFLEKLVPGNVVGLYNTYQAAQEAGVRRIVFASSCHTVTGYGLGREQTIEITDPVRPGTLYGVTKAFGEVLGRWYHDKHGLEFVGIRIGSVKPYDSEQLRQSGEADPWRDFWLSPGDAVRLFRRAIEKEGVGYVLVFGTSTTERERVSLRPARELLDFEPRDSIADIARSAE